MVFFCCSASGTRNIVTEIPQTGAGIAKNKLITPSDLDTRRTAPVTSLDGKGELFINEPFFYVADAVQMKMNGFVNCRGNLGPHLFSGQRNRHRSP